MIPLNEIGLTASDVIVVGTCVAVFVAMVVVVMSAVVGLRR